MLALRSLVVAVLAANLSASMTPVEAAARPGAARAASTVAVPAVPVCGVLDPAARPALARATPRTLRTGGVVDEIAVAGGLLHVLDADASVVRVLATDGALRRTVALPPGSSGMAVDPSGAVYTVDRELALVKMAPTGEVVWRRPWRDVLPAAPSHLAGVSTPSGWRLSVGVRSSEDQSQLLDADGTARGSGPYGTGVDGRVSASADGGVVVRTETALRHYDATGALVHSLGFLPGHRSPGGADLRIGTGSAVVMPDGRYLLPSGYQGVFVTDASGVVTGHVPDDLLGRLTQKPTAVIVGDALYYASGGPYNRDQTVSVLPVSTVLALASPLDSPRLGLGAGLTTAAKGNWFPAGTAPEVRAVLREAWGRQAGSWTLEYTVRSEAQVRSRTSVPAVSVPVPVVAAAPGGTALRLPAAEPGSYEVSARLLRDGRPVSGTCLRYTVGAPGHTLDLTTLPPGADAGGPAPARAVALADVLGTGHARVQLDWDRLLPDPGAPYRWAEYDAELTAAAAEARRRGVVLSVQVGQGRRERDFVEDGTWERRVQDVVEHFRATVDVWEAWNEPNATFGPPAAYVRQVLAPFARAVRAADPGAQVVGGSVVGLDLGYWQGIVDAGGLDHLDIAAVHPYGGHNRSYEEQGTPARLRQLLGVLRAAKPGVRLWDTESAWWSNGPFDVWAQADYSARARLWQRALGVERWNYFIPEGSWGNHGVSFSAIEVDDHVKPAALALMTSRTVLADRPFLGMVATGIPHTYAARFGPSGSDGSAVLAVWTDDLRTSVRIGSSSAAGTPVQLVQQLGARRAITITGGTALPVSGSVQYLVGPGADRLSLVAPQSYGPNLALGAVATASSELPGQAAAAAVDGVADAAGAGEWRETPAWASQPEDAAPTLTLQLRQRSMIDRVQVSTHSVASVAPGLRSYRVQVRDGATRGWTTVGTVQNAFFERTTQVQFAARRITDVRLLVDAVNYSGYMGGVAPSWWTPGAAGTGPAGGGPASAIVNEVAAFAPGATAR